MPNMKPIRVAESQHGEPPKTYGEGRKCTECGAKLNRYNKDDICHACSRSARLKGGPPLTGGQSKKL